MGIDKHQSDTLLKWEIRGSAGIMPMDLALPYRSQSQTIHVRFQDCESLINYILYI